MYCSDLEMLFAVLLMLSDWSEFKLARFSIRSSFGTLINALFKNPIFFKRDFYGVLYLTALITFLNADRMLCHWSRAYYHKPGIKLRTFNHWSDFQDKCSPDFINNIRKLELRIRLSNWSGFKRMVSNGFRIWSFSDWTWSDSSAD